MGLNILNAYTGKSGQTLTTSGNNMDLFDALAEIQNLDARFRALEISETFYRAEMIRLMKIVEKYMPERVATKDNKVQGEAG